MLEIVFLNCIYNRRVKNKKAKEKIYLDFIDVDVTDNVFEVNGNFYSKYNPQIRIIVARILNSADQSCDIDDCVSSVFLELMEKLQQ